MDAVQRAREALTDYDPARKFGPSHAAWAAIVRDLLAEQPAALTEDQREVVERFRERWPIQGAHVLAILDAHFPPPAPAINRGTPVKAWAIIPDYPLYGYYLEPGSGGGHRITMFKDGSGEHAFVDRVEPLEAP